MLKGNSFHNFSLATLPQIEYSQIHENREWLQALLDQIPQGVLILSAPQGEALVINRAARELRSRFPNYLALAEYRLSWSLFDANQIALALEELPLMKAFRGDSINSQEYIVEFPQGEKEFHRISASPLRDAQGEVFAGLLIVSNITQEKLVELSLQRSEAHYRELFENASDLIYTLDLAGNLTSFNKAAAALFGYTEDEARALNIRQIVAPEYLEKALTMIARKIAGEETPVFEIDTLTKAGQRVSLEINMRLLLHDGQPVGTQGIARNITERKRKDDEVRALKERFSKAFNASPYPMSITRVRDQRCIDVNESAIRHMGYSRQERLSKTVAELGIAPNPNLNRFWALFLKQGFVRDFELTVTTKSGEKRLGLFSAEQIAIDGEACALISQIDITEQRHSERVKIAAYEISEAANSTDNLQDMYTRIHRIVSELMYAGNFYIALLDADAEVLRIPYFVDEFDCNPQQRKLRRGLTEYVLRTQQPLHASPAVIQALEASHEVEAIGTFPVDWLGVPLKTKAKTIGVLTVQSYTEGLTYGEEEKQILIFVSTQIALAIERKHAEEALRTSQQWFSKVFNLTPNPIGINRLSDGQYVDVNQSFLDITKYAYNEVIGKTPDELNAWASPEQKAVFLQSIKERKKIHNMEADYQTKFGDLRYALVSAELIEINGEEYLLSTLNDITKRKAAEIALRASEERVSKAFNLSPIPMSLTTLQGVYIDVNDSFVRTSGYSRKELLGHSTDELNLFTSPEELLHLREVMRQSTSYTDIEIHWRAKSGDRRLAQISGERITIGGEGCWLVTCYDITERKRTEEALKASEERFSKAFNLSPLPMHIISLDDTSYIYVNDSLLKATGYTREEMVGKTGDQLNMWVSKEERSQIFKVFTETGKLDNLEVRFRRKDGEIRTCLGSSEIIMLDGKACALSILNDITERKHAEEALMASEERFAKTFNLSPLPMSLISLQSGKILNINDSFLKATGHTRDEVIGRSGSDLGLWVKEKDRDQGMNLLQAQQQIHNLEGRYRTKDGSIRTILFSAETISIDDAPCILTVINDITERKQKEEALKASEERFSTAFYLSPTPMCISTVDEGHFIDVNEAFAAALGATRQELIGRTSQELEFFADYTQRRDAFEVFKDKKRYQLDNIEMQYRKLDGEIRTGLLSAEIIHVDGRRCLLTVVNDITERKKHEEELLGARREWQATFDALSDTVMLLDKHDRLLRANKAFFEKSGLTYEEVIGRTAKELGHKNNRFISAEDCPLCELRAKRISGTIELPTGVITDFPVLASVDPIFNSDGDYIGCVEVTRNLSALYSARQEAEKERVSLKATIEQMAEGLMIFDDTPSVIRANSSAQKIFGFTLEEMLKDRHGALTEGRFADKDGRPLPSPAHPVRSALREQRTIRGTTVWYQRPDKQRVLLSITASPFFNEEGKLTGAVSLVRDITQQQRELERLQQADKLRALGQLASGVAHNFNNALAAVIGYSQLALRRTEDAEVIKHLRVIEQSSKDAARMVERIQNFSRTRSKQDEFLPARIADIVRDAVDITRPRWQYDAEAHGIKYLVTLAWKVNADFCVRCDPSQLREVFVNIIFNALDAMPAGGNLTINASAGESSISINFKDTGYGMSEEVKSRVFDPFFTTKGVAGLGLGLSESYRIIERHFGQIEADSQPQLGTTFTITLPLIPFESFGDKGEVGDLPLTRKRFLIVDDEKLVRYALASLLEELGHEVFQAATGQQALELAKDHLFDLVFTDLAMPDVDGIAAAQQLKALQPAVRIVLMSGYSSDKVQERIRDIACIDVAMSKPFRFDEVQEVIQKLVGAN
ncbi:MAG: PAS domain S-box protein [Acidobacteria bacterium]|nr:PAS domain S-box protein [Acidobacteriota bacterium]